MSQIPKDIKSKYNQDNKFKWVDSQLEKFMDKQKELEDQVKELIEENERLRSELYGDDYED